MRTRSALAAAALTIALTVTPAAAVTKPSPVTPKAWSAPLELRCMSALATTFGYVRPVRTAAQNKVLFTFITRNGGTPCRTLLKLRTRMNGQEK